MRDVQVGVVDADIGVDEEIEVDGTWPPAQPVADAALGALDRKSVV